MHAGTIDGIDDRQSLDMTGNTGAVYAFVIVFVVVVMGRRREHEEGDGENRGPML